MNLTKYILLLVLSFTLTITSNAQIKKSKPINSGFLFINGQYIETPYLVKRKGFSVYINNIRIYTENSKPKKNPLKSYTRRLSTPNCINKNSTKEDFHNCRDTISNETYYNYMSNYFLKYYPYEQAVDSFIHYLETYPNVKSIYKESYPPITINLYNGESWNYMYPGLSSKEISQKWGPNGTGDNVDKEKLKLRLDYAVEIFADALLANTTEIINIKEHYFNIVPTMGKKYTAYIYHIMQNDKLSNEQKFDSLNLLICGEKELRYFVNNYRITQQYINRIKKIRFDTLKYTKEQIDIKNKSSYNNKNTKNTDCYSPANNIVKIWCAYNYWDNAFNLFNLEYEQITKQIEGLGYTNVEFYTDDIANDEFDMDYGSCTYQNLINMKYAGIVYFGAHGSENGYILVQMSYDSNELFDGWAQSNNNVTIAEIPLSDIHNYEFAGNDGWDTQVYPYGAYVNYQWFNENWKTELTNSNAIVISSVCYGANNNLLDSYGGGVTFAYCEPTNYNNAIHNNPRLIKRMNGKLDNAEHREAYDAFNNFSSQAGFSINSNEKITLCPAPTDYTEGEVDESGTGFFELDTWCSTYYPADQILIQHEHTGDIQISNMHWIDDGTSDNKSKRIEYDWNGTGAFTMKFHVNTYKVLSYSETNPQGVHKLDFNGVTPNGYADFSNSYYSITHNAPATIVNFEADVQYIMEGETVQFTNISTLLNQTSFNWDFGDGYISTEENPSHIYMMAGVYDVSLKINDELELKSAFIVVHGEEDGSIYCTNEMVSNNNVHFFASYNNPTSPDYNYIFTFYFGNGETEIKESAINSVEYDYEYYYGTFDPSVNLSIIDINDNAVVYNNYCSCGSVSIEPPSCDNFSATIQQYPEYSTPNNLITFSAHNMSGIEPYSYQWWFLPATNGNPSMEISFDENPQVSFPSIGTYTVVLQVTDAYGCGASASYNIKISDPETCYPNTKIECWNSQKINNTVYVKAGCKLNFSFEHGFDYSHCVGWGCDEPEIGIWNVYRYWTSFYWNSTPQFYEFFSYNIESTASYDEGCFDVSWAFPSEKDFSYNFPGSGLWKVRITVKKECSESQFEGDVICHPNYYENFEYKATDDVLVHCVDCNTNSGFRTDENELSSDLVGIGPTFSAGNFWLRANDNIYLNNNDVIFTACNKIEMYDGFDTGINGLFIAQTGSSVFEECDNSLKYNDYTIENKSLINSTLNVYPNPFDNEINIEIKLKEKEKTKIDLCNIEGKIIRTLLKQNLSSNTNYSFSFVLNDIEVGAYLIKIWQNNELISTKKIIKKQ